MTTRTFPKPGSRAANFIIRYNMKWPIVKPAASIEIECIRRGGQWMKSDGTMAGEGLFYHYKRLQELLWPEKVWHKWNLLQLEEWIKHRSIAIIGPASSGKTNSAATDHLADWYCFPECTTVICCSTTKERLEDRVWGEIKKYHKAAQKLHPWLPGYLIEGRQRILNDSKLEAADGRDFRNGLVGVPCKKGSDYVGLGDFAGLKNKRVRLLGDELSLLPKVFVEAISNLDKNPDFKATGLGNPKDTNDALGVMAEPSVEVGGWESGIDQDPGTKKWPTRRPDGICIQLPGSDSPNLDGRLGIPIINQEQIDRDVAFYGKDSLQYTMMNEGRMPRGHGARRVLTRQMCRKFGAYEQPIWDGNPRTQIAFLDAAYRGVGGDRCIFGTLEFGREAQEINPDELSASVVVGISENRPGKQNIIAINDIMPIPVGAGMDNDLPEDQIVRFVMEQCTARMIPPQNFFFDSGMRTSLVTAFTRLWSTSVESVDFGAPPSETPVSSDIQTLCCDYYSKFVTELWFNVRLAVEAGQVRNFNDDIVNEFGQREWTVVASNKIEVEPKWKMREKTGRSPDIADAIACGFYGARRRGFNISRMTADKRKRGRDWRDLLRDKESKIRQAHELSYN